MRCAHLNNVLRAEDFRCFSVLQIFWPLRGLKISENPRFWSHLSEFSGRFAAGKASHLSEISGSASVKGGAHITERAYNREMSVPAQGAKSLKKLDFLKKLRFLEQNWVFQAFSRISLSGARPAGRARGGRARVAEPQPSKPCFVATKNCT